MAVVGDRWVGLLWVACRHGMVVAIQVRGRLSIVDDCQQLRAHMPATRQRVHCFFGESHFKTAPLNAPSVPSIKQC